MLLFSGLNSLGWMILKNILNLRSVILLKTGKVHAIFQEAQFSEVLLIIFFRWVISVLITSIAVIKIFSLWVEVPIPAMGYQMFCFQRNLLLKEF